MHCGYVLTDRGDILLQLPVDNACGFVLADENQLWPGGVGIACKWEALEDNDARITPEMRKRLRWMVDR